MFEGEGERRRLLVQEKANNRARYPDEITLKFESETTPVLVPDYVDPEEQQREADRLVGIR